MRALNITLIGILASFVACGGGGEETETTPPDETGTTGGETEVTETSSGGETAWADMDREQRLAFMQNTVTPEMAAMFQEFDGERFADFGCPTCHGDTMQDVDFAMPNGVSPLDPTTIPAMFESDQPMAQFMTQQVWPRMTEMLGQQPFNPETNEGFSCLNCHAVAEGSAK